MFNNITISDQLPIYEVIANGVISFAGIFTAYVIAQWQIQREVIALDKKNLNILIFVLKLNQNEANQIKIYLEQTLNAFEKNNANYSFVISNLTKIPLEIFIKNNLLKDTIITKIYTYILEMDKLYTGYTSLVKSQNFLADNAGVHTVNSTMSISQESLRIIKQFINQNMEIYEGIEKFRKELLSELGKIN